MRSATAVAERSVSIPLRAYYDLTKPGITLFVAVSAAAGYLATTAGRIEPAALGALLLATVLLSGGAATLNQVAERAFDAAMRRTARRPVPAGILTARSAARFGWALSLLGAAVGLIALPLPSILFLAACHMSYVYLYTPLKRCTPLSTLAGTIPGALPVLAGCTATGLPIDLAGLALTGVLFVWQVPHFLAIGWLAREDYARAGFPMLAVVDGTGRLSARVAFVYTLATLAFVLLLVHAAPLGPLASALVVAAGAGYVAASVPFLRRAGTDEARRLFFASILVLPVVLGILMVGSAVGPESFSR